MCSKAQPLVIVMMLIALEVGGDSTLQDPKKLAMNSLSAVCTKTFWVCKVC